MWHNSAKVRLCNTLSRLIPLHEHQLRNSHNVSSPHRKYTHIIIQPQPLPAHNLNRAQHLLRRKSYSQHNRIRPNLPPTLRHYATFCDSLHRVIAHQLHIFSPQTLQILSIQHLPLTPNLRLRDKCIPVFARRGLFHVCLVFLRKGLPNGTPGFDVEAGVVALHVEVVLEAVEAHCQRDVAHAGFEEGGVDWVLALGEILGLTGELGWREGEEVSVVS